jgi:hypothetical protein
VERLERRVEALESRLERRLHSMEETLTEASGLRFRKREE